MVNALRILLRAVLGAVAGAALLLLFGKVYGLTGIRCTSSICNPNVAITYGVIGGALSALFLIPRRNPFQESNLE